MKPLCVISCPIDTFSGYGARSRDLVKALIKSKDKELDIKIMPKRWGDTPWNFLSLDDPLRQRMVTQLTTQPDVWFQITVPNEFQPVGKFNIGVTAGIETDVFPGEFIEGMNRMNLNLVSSEHSKYVAGHSKYDRLNKEGQKVAEIKLEKPCEVLFEGLDLNKYFKKPEKSGILDNIVEDFCFLFTGHWLPGNYGEDRKNTALLIRTFLETFKGLGKKPALILKTSQVNYSLIDREQILKHINNIKSKIQSDNLPNIYLLHGEMTDEEMNQLNNDPKVKSFVSFTKGEGFGRPLLEAAITGKPVITTNWSGHVDFLKPDYNVLVGGELKPVHNSAANKFLIKESKWFNINIDIASRAMKDIFKKYKKYFKESRKQTQYLKENWSLDKLVEKLNSYLPEPAQTLSINLPKLKKINKPKQETPKISLPKLKKIEA